MRIRDWAICIGKAVLLSAIIAWLFYRSIYGCLVIFPIVGMFYLSHKNARIKERKARLRGQFRECIRVVTASLYSGYSMENAFAEAEKELVELLGTKAEMCMELQRMNQQIRLNIPIESLLQNLADRSGVEEIFSFGQVFGYAKRNGSDFARILKETAERIGEKIELEQELQTLIAGKQMEQKIMNVIPLGILLFVQMTSPGFLDIMYSGMLGRTLMTIFLAVYMVAYLLSRKIADIKI